MPRCPSCGSHKTFRNGHRFSPDGQKTQRWLCPSCGYRFSETSNSPALSTSAGQICAVQVKNLAKQLEKGEEHAGNTTTKGKLVEYSWYMQKEGYAEATITRRTRLLSTLAVRGADLLDPESVKETMAKQSTWGLKTKELAVEAYSCFLKMSGGKWQPPKYKPVRTLPFIPTEREIDELIASCNAKTATFLQLLKETGMRSGEAWMLKWTDFDIENVTVRVTPEKGGEPRLLKISSKLIAMLNALPKTRQETFIGSLRHFARSYRRQRTRLARKLKNERIRKITFHTFRHWRATMEYARTKDILHVMKMLGHRSIQNTLLYTQLVNFEGDEFHSATAKTAAEGQKLVEAGFEYVCSFENVKVFKKRK